MDITKADERVQEKRSSREEAPVTSGITRREDRFRRGSAPLGNDLRNHFDDLKEKHRVLRYQYQHIQSERDKVIEEARAAKEQSKMLRWKVEEVNREKSEIQKKLEQRQIGQYSRYEQEAMAKQMDALRAQNRMLQHEKDQLDQRVRQELDAKHYEQLKSLKSTLEVALEESEQDRDSLRFKLSELKRENERLNEKLACIGPNYDSSQREIDKIIDKRDQLRSQVSELRRDNHSLKEKLSIANKAVEASGKAETSGSRRRSEQLQDELRNLRADKDQLAEENNDLSVNLEGTECRLRDLVEECERLRQVVAKRDPSPVRRRLGERLALSRGGSEEMLVIKRQRSSASQLRGKFSQGSNDDDFSDHQQSLTDLAALTLSDSGQHPSSQQGEMRLRSHSMESKKKLSSSTSNLTSASGLHERAPSLSQLNEVNSKLRLRLSRCEKTLEETKREKLSVSSQLAKVEQERMDLNSQLHAMERELEMSRQELAKTTSQSKAAQNQIESLVKAKGVAMKDNAVSYQQSIQQETRVRELQAENELLEQKRGIAKKEREKVISEVVGLRRKLDTIKTQRQKDAKELSGMRHLKDKAVQSLEKHRASMEELQRSKKSLGEELAKLQQSISHASGVTSQRPKASASSSAMSLATGGQTDGGSASQGLQTILERLRVVENEKNVICKKLFGAESGGEGSPSLGDIVHRLDTLFQERDNLLVEISALQQSSSKLNEDTIFDLKQRIEDLHMDKDALAAQVKNLRREVTMLNSKVVKTEQERDKLSIDCERLELQSQVHKAKEARLVQEHTKTLERVNELWKQKWPHTWDEAWEEKNIQVPLGSDGFAGFSVVGGRDQPQIPNPAAFIVTTVNTNGPADGMLKVGDILESVNGVSLANADHREAVRAVKESKGMLNIVLRRRRNALPIQMGIVSAINAVPHLDPKPAPRVEQHDFSLYVTNKENPGFRYEWSISCTVSEVTPSGPAHQILHVGDRLITVNNTSIAHEKPSNVKKLMKPHKNILKLLIERPQKNDRSYLGQALPSNPSDWTPTLDRPEPSAEQRSWVASTGSSTPSGRSKPGSLKSGCHSDEATQQTLSSWGSYSDVGPKPERLRTKEPNHKACRDSKGHEDLSRYTPQSRESYSSSRDDGYSQGYTQSQESVNQPTQPTKLVSVVTAVKMDPATKVGSPPQRPMSDGVVYGNYNERRIEYEEVLQSERTDSQFSQTESYLSESSYGYGLSSCQSIDLTFHSHSTMPQCHPLTVDTVMTTQFEERSQQSMEEEYRFLARDDASRTAIRSRAQGEDSLNVSNGVTQSQSSESTDSHLSESQNSSTDHDHCDHRKGFKRRLMRPHRGKASMHGSRSLTKLSGTGNGYSGMGMRGRSLSNISLGHAPSMTSVREEPRRSTSTTNVSDKDERDPLADATYIRANFTHISRNPRELTIKNGDVFHIHEEAPKERYRASFWVSRLNVDGTDEQIGAIPNSIKAQEYLEAQGESVDMTLYEEVEAFVGNRPVLIFGALADQVTATLLESYPDLFFACPTETVEGVARVTEARLKRESSEGKIIDFWRTDNGFEVIRADAISSKENKSKHCLLSGTFLALQSLKNIAPPITIFVKAMTEESIITFSPEQISEEQAREMFEEISLLQEQHGREFSASILLIYMDTLMGQIENIIHKEKRKQAWVPVPREL